MLLADGLLLGCSDLLGLTRNYSDLLFPARTCRALESRRALQAPNFSEIRTAIHGESEDIASAPERMTSPSTLIPRSSSICFSK